MFDGIWCGNDFVELSELSNKKMYFISESTTIDKVASCIIAVEKIYSCMLQITNVFYFMLFIFTL